MSRDYRAEVREALKKVSPEDRALFSSAVSKRLIQSFTLHRPTSVGLYAALPSEVSLNELCQWCSAQGIPTAFPRIEEDHPCGMRFRKADPSDQKAWEKAAFGFPQPKVTDPEWRPTSTQDVILVPGLVFGESGQRVGRGKGHYDRYLPHCPAFRLGVAFDIQVLAEVGQNPWDQAMHAVVTPTRWIGTQR